MPESSVDHPDGIDLTAVTRWMRDEAPGLRPPLSFRPIPGGRSNLTFAVCDADGRCRVLRRPPLSQVLPSAHDMGREYRVLNALAATAVPVPQVYGLCQDESVTGAPFYVMELVDGVVPLMPDVVADALSADGRASFGPDLIGALALLHGVDPVSVGLANLGRGGGYTERQLRRWRQQLDRMGLADTGSLAQVAADLHHALPPQELTTIVHGDYRPANVVVNPATGHVRAILDWELATLGDPVADLAWLLNYWSRPEGVRLPSLTIPTDAAGFSPEEDLLTTYETRGRADLAHLPFHRAFCYWKLAVILVGVDFRRRQGAYGEEEARSEDLPETIEELCTLSREALAS